MVDDKARDERWKAYVEADYNPFRGGAPMPPNEARVANAADYAAYQLGQINQSLKQIARLLGEKT